MLLSEQQSWKSCQSELKALKNTVFYKNDVELQELIQQAEGVLANIEPNAIDFSGKGHVLQWDLLRSLKRSIDERLKMNATRNKILIVYYSIYRVKEYNGREIGCRKEYARELANELFWKKFSAETCGNKNLTVNKIKECSTIIFCSSSYFGTYRAASCIAKYYEQLKDKKLVVFTCGLANTGIINKAFDSIISPNIRGKLKIFHTEDGEFIHSNKKILEPIVDYCSINFKNHDLQQM